MIPENGDLSLLRYYILQHFIDGWVQICLQRFTRTILFAKICINYWDFMTTTLSYHDKNNLKSKLNDFDVAHATSPIAQRISSLPNDSSHPLYFLFARENPEDLSDVWCEEELLFDWATRAMGQAGFWGWGVGQVRWTNAFPPGWDVLRGRHSSRTGHDQQQPLGAKFQSLFHPRCTNKKTRNSPTKKWTKCNCGKQASFYDHLRLDERYHEVNIFFRTYGWL